MIRFGYIVKIMISNPVWNKNHMSKPEPQNFARELGCIEAHHTISWLPRSTKKSNEPPTNGFRCPPRTARTKQCKASRSWNSSR